MDDAGHKRHDATVSAMQGADTETRVRTGTVRTVGQHHGMSSGRNSPCPCGSGRKHKRCCGGRERDQRSRASREQRVGRDAEKWAFEHFGEEMVTAGGELMRRLGSARDASWIVEHWVMLDYELREGGTAAARYAERQDLSAADRECAARIATSRIGVFRVRACRPGERIDLEGVGSGEQVTVASTSVSRQAQQGDVLLARVLDGAPRSLWGPARAFAPRDAAVLLDHLVAADDLLHAWPALMALETPREASAIASAEWDIDDAEAVFEALPDVFEYDGEEDGADVFAWRIGPRDGDFGGLLWLYRDGIVLHTYARSLVDDAIDLIDAALGSRARLTERQVGPLTGGRWQAQPRAA